MPTNSRTLSRQLSPFIAGGRGLRFRDRLLASAGGWAGVTAVSWLSLSLEVLLLSLLSLSLLVERSDDPVAEDFLLVSCEVVGVAGNAAGGEGAVDGPPTAKNSIIFVKRGRCTCLRERWERCRLDRGIVGQLLLWFCEPLFTDAGFFLRSTDAWSVLHEEGYKYGVAFQVRWPRPEGTKLRENRDLASIGSLRGDLIVLSERRGRPCYQSGEVARVSRGSRAPYPNEINARNAVLSSVFFRLS